MKQQNFDFVRLSLSKPILIIGKLKIFRQAQYDITLLFRPPFSYIIKVLQSNLLGSSVWIDNRCHIVAISITKVNRNGQSIFGHDHGSTG